MELSNILLASGFEPSTFQLMLSCLAMGICISLIYNFVTMGNLWGPNTKATSLGLWQHYPEPVHPIG